MNCSSIISTVPWPGSARNCPRQSRLIALVPGCVKISSRSDCLPRRRDLFTDLSVVFMDTTSLYFEGEGGAELGERGHSKDYRRT